ncbi:cell division protein FtsW [Neosynechococcus sphagnicola sy1]|uniref:Peptidoglycan glycosyltransferase RodA n=1 Tax=Neosynechococcus sphagnicola sy1 TaxID=1497020 RepID=A0A098TLC6_9CYAN|nr:rod shape-determining protein RodA [Neosynechococcus sphagnicola]KGF72677.1 cell division protein FtsW [Neosynechococcus sphagnicola sy1]
MLHQPLPRIRWKILFQPWQEMDRWLFILPLGLTFLGGIMIRSVELNHGWTDWWQHWLTGAVGIALALAIARWRYDHLLRWRWWIYGITNLSLLAVMFIGRAELGAQRWISIAGFNLQPSEFAKLGIIITIAALLHERPASTIPAVLKTLAITAVPWALVFLEPNLGTSLVFGAITLGMLYWGQANPGWLLLLLSPPLSAILFNISVPLWLGWVLFLGTIAWFTLPWPRSGALAAVTVNLVAGELGHVLWGILKPYQKSRLILFLNPDSDPLGGGYHLIQSRIAVGAGEMWGRGLYKGTQTQLNFIPEQHTDFIFTAIGEELGFIGCVLVLLAFWLICLRLVIVAQNAKDAFGSLIAIGVLSMVIFQVLVNIGMTIGLSPVTGIPLPWLSYGRSALLMNFLAIGLVESVANHRQRMKL